MMSKNREENALSSFVNLISGAVFQIVTLIPLLACALSFCSCNDRNREQIHIQRRQALRNRQREAAISGRSVRSVIETEVESEDANCPRLSCVRMTPRLKNSETDDVYRRLNNNNDHNITKMEKEKPPTAIEFENFLKMSKDSKNGSESDDNLEHNEKRVSAESDNV